MPKPHTTGTYRSAGETPRPPDLILVHLSYFALHNSNVVPGPTSLSGANDLKSCARSRLCWSTLTAGGRVPIRGAGFAGTSDVQRRISVDFPSLDERVTENLDRPFAVTGRRAYLVGYMNGRFPDLGHHLPGEM